MQNLIKQNIKVDLVLTDTPYNITSQKWDNILDLKTVWELLAKLVRSKNTPILLFSTGRYTYKLVDSNFPGFKYKLYWNKLRGSNPFIAKVRPMSSIEEINVFTIKGDSANYYPQLIPMDKPQIYAYPKNTNCYSIKATNVKKLYTHKQPLDLLNYKKQYAENKFHPNAKPIALLEWLIKSYSLENQIVLDFTMGSGSTGVACKNLNRKFIGIELDTKYFNIAKDRINTIKISQ